jgi:hypothetical protein
MLPRWLLALLLLLCLQVSADWYSTPDTARYLSIARSMAAGDGIADLDNTAPYFPPGYPALITAPFLFSERPFLAISIIHLFLAAIFAVATWSWARRRIGCGAALVTALVLVNASFLYHYRRPLSELAFMTAAMVAVELLESIRSLPLPGWRGSLRLAAAAAVLAFLPLIREAGLVFSVGFAALAAGDWKRGRRPHAIPPRALYALALAGIVSAGLFLWYDVWEAGRSATPAAIHFAALLDPPGGHVEWLRKVVGFRIGEVGRIVFPGALHQTAIQTWRDVRLVVFVPIVLFALYGWWRLLGRGDLLAVIAPLYVGMYLIWGFEAGTRYMLPLLPLLAGSLWISVEWLGPWRRWLFAALVAAHLVASLWDWRTFDAPIARRCAEAWPTAEAISRALPPRASISIDGDVPECLWTMLVFLRDETIFRDPYPWPQPQSTQWRLEPASRPARENVEIGTKVGAYHLARRLDHAPAASR